MFGTSISSMRFMRVQRQDDAARQRDRAARLAAGRAARRDRDARARRRSASARCTSAAEPAITATSGARGAELGQERGVVGVRAQLGRRVDHLAVRTARRRSAASDRRCRLRRQRRSRLSTSSAARRLVEQLDDVPHLHAAAALGQARPAAAAGSPGWRSRSPSAPVASAWSSLRCCSCRDCAGLVTL